MMSFIEKLFVVFLVLQFITHYQAHAIAIKPIVWDPKLRVGVEEGILYEQEARAYGFPEKKIRKPVELFVPTQCMENGTDPLNFYRRFRRFDEIDAYIEQLQTQYPELLTIETIGKSVEGNPIKVMIVSAPLTSPNQLRNSVLVTSAMHGREWTTIPGVVYSIEQILSGYHRKIAKYVNLLQNVAIHAIPVLNPDGYQFTFSTKPPYKKSVLKRMGRVHYLYEKSRLFRKNRRGPFGVDLNRNFGSEGLGVWNASSIINTRRIKSANTYQGPSGFSEPETRALRDYVQTRLSNKKNHDSFRQPNRFGHGRLTAYHDIHCCIGAILEPYSHVRMPDATVAHFTRIGKEVAIAMSGAGETTSSLQNKKNSYVWRARSNDSIASGISSSWAFQEERVNLTFVVEVRGHFVVPCHEILPIAKETLAGLLVVGKHAAKVQPYDWSKEGAMAWTLETHKAVQELLRAETANVQQGWKIPIRTWYNMMQTTDDAYGMPDTKQYAKSGWLPSEMQLAQDYGKVVGKLKDAQHHFKILVLSVLLVATMVSLFLKARRSATIKPTTTSEKTTKYLKV